MIRTTLAAVLLLCAAPTLAQQAGPPPPAGDTAQPAVAPVAPPSVPAPPPVVTPPAAAPVVAPPAAATVRVALTTAQGTIVLALEKVRAPLTTAYFLRYVDQKRLDGSTFYRANRIDAAGKYGLIQGGVRDPKKLLPPVAHEPTTKTGLSHTDGTISLARLAPGTATANFFIVVGDLSSLDANPRAAGDNQGFAAFGHVVEGMDVVHRILAAPTSPTAGGGAMKGQMIEAPVKILAVRRIP